MLRIVAAHEEIDSIIQLGLGIQGNTAALIKSGMFYPEHGLQRIVEFHELQEHRYAKAAMSVSHQHNKPVLVASELAVTQPINPMVSTLRLAGQLCFSSADRAVAALGHLVRYATHQKTRT